MPATTLAAVVGCPDAGSSACANDRLKRLLAFLAEHKPADGLTHAIVAVTEPCHADLLAAMPGGLGLTTSADWPEQLPPGFHRLAAGQWLFTICVGPVELSVAQWRCDAQHLWLSEPNQSDKSTAALFAHAVARQCARGCTLSFDQTTPVDTSAWGAAGFVPSTANQPSVGWNYLPRWPVPARSVLGQRTALVIGAGLAGAAACASLTRRGWQVTLLDAGSGPAQGASGLPVGMLSEHVTTQETTLSRLSRSGMALHFRELQRLVPEGKGWQHTQVSNLRAEGSGDDEGGNGTPVDACSQPTAANELPVSAHTIPAAMVRPGVLVEAWLEQAKSTGRLTECWLNRVAKLEHQGNGWRALDGQGGVLAYAAHVVVAAAHGSADLLRPQGPCLPADTTLRPVKGQLSYAPLAGTPLAPHPLRDHGVYVPCFEDSTHPHATRMWAMGSTYERGQTDTEVTSAGHDRNAASLKATLPAAHALFAEQREAGQLHGWAQIRCASVDRLPLVGALPSASHQLCASMQLPDVPRLQGAWTLCALGSRGLTLSLLAAELLVAQMENEPWPLEKDLGQALDPARFALKHARKTGIRSVSGMV